MKLGLVRRSVITRAITVELATSNRAQEQPPPNAQLPADFALLTVQNAAVARIQIEIAKPMTTAVMLLTLMSRAAKMH